MEENEVSERSTREEKFININLSVNDEQFI